MKYQGNPRTRTTPYQSDYGKSKKSSHKPWYMDLTLKVSVCIVATLHLIFLYLFCNGVPLTIMNVVWEMQGLRPLPLR
jgi:hypothetical protein